MTMTAAEIRLKANPILTSMLLGMGQGIYVARHIQDEPSIDAPPGGST